jgi:Ohr subfamily peroxiredoxin
MENLMSILYKATATSTGGRDGRAVSSDEQLDVKLSASKELGGTGAPGTNPEQLFAAGYSACFLSAMKFVAGQRKQAVPAETTVTADVGVGPNDKGGFALDIELRVSLPGLDAAAAQELVNAAHQVCPYSNATRGNVDVRVNVV